MQPSDPSSTPPGPTDSRCGATHEATPNAIVVRRINLAADAAIFHVAPDGYPLPAFEPGQFAILGLPCDELSEQPKVAKAGAHPFPNDPHTHGHVSPGLLRRAYSIASPPSNREYLEFYIIRIEQGRFTTRLWDLQEGDRIWLDPNIRGHFTLANIPRKSDLLMVATGTGIAPYMSMLRGHTSRNRWNRAALIHGVRFVADLAYRNELEQLAMQDDKFAYVPTVTREPASTRWSGLRGRIQALIGDAESLKQQTGIGINPATCHVMLCGNPAMIEETQKLLENQGLSTGDSHTSGNIHFERYW